MLKQPNAVGVWVIAALLGANLLVLLSTNVQAKSTSRIVWEYKWVRSDFGGDGYTWKALNAAGREGWEAVNWSGDKALLKRRKQ